MASLLDAPAPVVWRALRSPRTLAHVAAPLLRFPAIAPGAGPWREGAALTTPVLLFGVLPVSRHTVRVELFDDAAMTARTAEHGGPFSVWRHTLRVQPSGPLACRYTDEVELDAGRLTGVLAPLVTAFFRWRHRRWRALAPVLAAAAG